MGIFYINEHYARKIQSSHAPTETPLAPPLLLITGTVSPISATYSEPLAKTCGLAVFTFHRIVSSLCYHLQSFSKIKFCPRHNATIQ